MTMTATKPAFRAPRPVDRFQAMIVAQRAYALAAQGR